MSKTAVFGAFAGLSELSLQVHKGPLTLRA